MASTIIFGLGLSLLLFLHGVASVDYGKALKMSLMYFESQRSGKLPTNQRVQWRGDSGLKDGSDAGIDLVGGYYDSGDNVKFGFPMAFTTTMLAWSVVEFKTHLKTKSELSNALEAIKWGTNYMIKAHPTPDILYGQVGDGDSDHECWMRPEDMTTPRTTFKIDEQHPGSDLVGETSAALAAATIAFKDSDAQYADLLLTHARQLFEFARNSRGKYQDSIPSVGKFYSSSGYEDELLWAAAWLYRATGDEKYLKYLLSADNIGDVRTMFSWDDKFLGAQVLVSKMILDGSFDLSNELDMYQANAERFICMCIQKANEYNMKMTPGGLLWFQTWNGLQYTTTATFVLVAYADYLSILDNDVPCGDYGRFGPNDLISFAKSQVDYILGSNPKNMSYMVGLGSNYPTQVHHRGASIVSIKNDSTLVTCKGGYDNWFNKKAANPNVLQGAIVGGPDQDDGYIDSRSNFQQAEPATVNTAPLVGVLARLSY